MNTNETGIQTIRIPFTKKVKQEDLLTSLVREIKEIKLTPTNEIVLTPEEAVKKTIKDKIIDKYSDSDQKNLMRKLLIAIAGTLPEEKLGDIETSYPGLLTEIEEANEFIKEALGVNE